MKKSLVISIISTFCLTSIILLTIPVHSYTPYTYDPWLDVNDDGKINLIDTFTEDLAFGTSGTPVNKTALLYNVSDTLASLLAKIDSLNATVIEQQNIINNLNNTVLELQDTTSYLNTTVDYLNQTVIFLNSTRGLGAPDYDSGWVGIGFGAILYFNHNLNSTNLMIYAVGRGWVNPDYGVWVQSPLYQIYYGGNTNDANNGAGPQYQQGLYWYATNDNQLAVKNFGVQCYGGWESVRIEIWKIP